MRSSTIILGPFFFFAGLVDSAPKTKTVELQPDFQGPETGKVCCDGGTNFDTDNFCGNKSLNAFCCSGFRSDRKGRNGVPGGCDPFVEFPTGRNVKTFPNGNQQCFAGALPGFIGCA
ncbi:hypothetical protein PspLS_09393 [Pyricularia sp. CBS 133598]|nr:hypothetical protein PspLS_09393 [Pyricularia sp. CBS 133598]